MVIRDAQEGKRRRTKKESLSRLCLSVSSVFLSVPLTQSINDVSKSVESLLSLCELANENAEGTETRRKVRETNPFFPFPLFPC
jgi:hypothetical protein